LRPKRTSGSARQRILEADETGTEVARGEQSYNQWKDGRAAAIEQASRPSIKVQTATAFAAAAGLSEPDLRRIQIETVSRADIERPSGRRFGALVHAVLAAVNLDASTDEILAVAQANARLIDATAGEIDSTVKTVRRALQHPLLQRAARAKVLRRETPIQHYRDDGSRDHSPRGTVSPGASTHDRRAKEAQPVAPPLGPRLLQWQLEQTAKDSWDECERHAERLEALLGRPFAADAGSLHALLPGATRPTDLFGQPLRTDLFGNVVAERTSRGRRDR
jgi:hypothetical protein